MARKFPKLASKALLSPMAGVTDVAFRTLARSYGAGLTYTEFASSTAIVRGARKTMEMIRTDKSEKPVAVQLFGASVEEVVSAAKIVEEDFDIIDVNCGCPAWKVVRTGAGSALLNNPKEIGRFIEQLVDGVNRPVTIKIRTGIDDSSVNALEVARVAEESGASAVAIHGRTQKQGYRGEADWDVIKRVKESVGIPVIGNGDVFSPEDFKRRLDESGVDAIMIARGAIGRPYIFKQIEDYLKTGAYEERNGFEQFFEYLEIAERYDISFSNVKAHAMSFTKGIVGGAKLRLEISQAKSLEDIRRLFDEQKRS